MTIPPPEELSDKPQKKYAGVPLRSTLVTTIVVVIFLTTLVVALTSARSASVVIDWLWDQLSNQLVNSTIERSLRYFDVAPPLAKQSAELMKDAKLHLAPNNAIFFNYGADILSTYPEIAAVTYIDSKGSYVSLGNPDAQVIGIQCLQEGTLSCSKHVAMGLYRRNEDRSWSAENRKNGQCSLSIMPWWEKIFTLKEGVWTEPYVSDTVKSPVFTYIYPVIEGGVATGFWLFEFTTATLSDFVSKVHVGQEGKGKVFIVTKDGKIVANPANSEIHMVNERGVLVPAKSIPMDVRQAWHEIQKQGDQTYRFETNGFICVSKPFPESSGIDWYVIAAIPSEELFGAIHKTVEWHLIGACLFALIMIFFGASFLGKISTSLRNVAQELSILKNFTISDRVFSTKEAMIREVNVMNEAVDSLKSGLNSFGRYVPKALVVELLQTGHEATLGGSRKELTVLFSDLVGFTEMSERLPPDELVHTLARYFSAMQHVVAGSKGVVDKYIGDSIMAFWGAPKPLAEHALMACLAALEMRSELRRLNIEWANQGFPVLRQRIGVNTGLMVIGNVGSPDRLNYTVMGDSVNLASRMEGLNRWYGTEILIGENTADIVADAILLRPVDWVCVKGKQDIVLIYEPIAMREKGTAQEHAAVVTYTEGLELYRHRRFTEARTTFEKSSVLFGGNDGPSLVMMTRCEEFILSPPGDDWNGSHAFATK